MMFYLSIVYFLSNKSLIQKVLCLCACHTLVTVYKWRSEDNIQELVLCFSHVGDCGGWK